MPANSKTANSNAGTSNTADSNGQLADRGYALILAGLLLLAGVLIGLSPLLGVVVTADSSPTTASAVAAFVAILPGALALVLAARRPILGLAATAGGGLIGMVRLLTDVAVVTETDRITRPELFAETTDRARPFSAGAGAWLLIAADVLWLVVGVLAAVRTAAAISSVNGPRSDDIFGGPDTGSDGSDPNQDGRAVDDGTAVVAALSQPRAGRRPLNLPMVSAGFLGALLLMVGALGTPYSGGYLDLRVLPFGSSLTGLVAAALLGFLAAVVVLVAAALPRSIAMALLAGTALAAAVPSVTALVAVLTGAPTTLSPIVWCGLAGSVILALTGLLARSGAASGVTRDPDGTPPQHWLTVGTGALALLAAGALAGASQSAVLYLDGAAPDGIAGAALAPAGPPQLVAAIPLAIAGVMALIRPVAAAGRAAVAVLWAGAAYAFGQALWARSLVLATAGDSSTNQHTWTSGPGQWLSMLGTLLALSAAVLAVVTTRRVNQASLDIVDDESFDASRTARLWPAVALAMLIVIALALPVHTDLTGAAPTLLHGYDLDTWGFWALAIGGIGAVWAASATRFAGPAAAWLVSAAALVVQPLIVPAVLRDVAGYAWSAGLWAGIVAVVLLLAASPYFAAMAGRVRAAAATVVEHRADTTPQSPPCRSRNERQPMTTAESPESPESPDRRSRRPRRVAPSGWSWQNPGSMGTIAGSRWLPVRCGTPAWRSFTPVCIRRPNRSLQPHWPKTLMRWDFRCCRVHI